MNFGGMSLTGPVNRIKAGVCALAVNVRAYLTGGFALRNPLTDPTGPPSPASSSLSTGTVTQSGPGTDTAWTTPTDIFASGSSYAQISLVPGTTSQTLNIVFAFAIPLGATITGIQFALYSAASGPAAPSGTFQPTQAGSPAGTPTTQMVGGLSGYPITIGGMGQLLGFAWTPALINAGLGLSITCTASAGTFGFDANLQSLVATVFYTNTLPINLPAPPHSIRRLNDSTPNGPPSGYVLVIGAAGKMYVNNSQVASGMSGNPVSMVPFRPNASPQPYMYIGDSSLAVSIPSYIASGYGLVSGMLKIRSDGLTTKMGIKEPQLAPVVSTAPANVSVTGTLKATDIPWTNYLGQNPSFNYGESSGPPDPTPDGTPPFIIDVANATTITITSLTGTATINGGPAAPTDAGPTPGSTNPGGYVQVAGSVPGSVSVVVGAFTDGDGNVLPLGVAPLYVTSVVDVGGAIGTPITVPYGAQQFQIGINSTGNTFHSNLGSFALAATVTTDALPAVTSILGAMNLYYWDDSPTSGGVASYLWKNPGDVGGGIPRSTSNAVGTTSGNSFIFDATFTSGVPALPGIGSPSVPMLWSQLNPDEVVVATNPVFPAPLTKTYPNNTQFSNFNFCLTGSIYFPAAGNYTFVLTNHDDMMWGIGGGVTLVSATQSGSGEGSSVGLSSSGQTITVVSGLPLLPRQNYTSGLGGNYAKTTVVVSVPGPGIYPIEVDYDYWFHSGRILLIMADPTPGAGPAIIPPLPQSVRQQVQYRGVCRSTATGALSNPSPASSAETVPVTSNTITLPYSLDPQVDVCDYYRIDETTADYTYVNTGPNDGLGPVIGGVQYNTPVTDSLLDTELGTQLLEYDNFEPFPSIDLPQKGICSVSGGVITWVSGGAIGGSQTGFNPDWLGGTIILIGSPTSLPYTFVARPTSTTTMEIPDVPDGTNLAYQIPEPILAAQPLAYLFGPTDNINFCFGVGDPLRPGTLYWCKGSNLDSAPDTNQEDVTDPSEPLVNGAISGGMGVLGSIKRWWTITPNFFNALATATGTTGSTWTMRLTSISRGLFIPRCLVVTGSGGFYFRVDDGIHYSQGGQGSQSITDKTLYPLFSHEGSEPQSITRNGFTFVPPDDSLPQSQKFSYQNGYLYYDYIGIDANPHTIVFDEAAGGFISDVYSFPAVIHAPNEGASVQGVLVGCIDGSIRLLSSSGTETVTGTVLTGAVGGIGWQDLYQVTVEYSSEAAVTLSFVAADEGNGSYAPSPVTLPSTSGEITKYTFKVTANKWKLLQFQFQSTDLFMAIYLDGCVCQVRDWGSTGAYKSVNPFAGGGGEGGQP